MPQSLALTKSEEKLSVRYRPLSRRRRLLIGVLAIVTAITIVLTLLYPPGGVKRTRPLPAPCTAQQQTQCIGGRADVIVIPQAASAPR